MIDVPLLRKELEFVTHNRELWDQSRWVAQTDENVCGTVGCLAGNALLHAGLVYAYSDVRTQKSYYDHVGCCWQCAGGKLFGLHSGQAACLFNSGNTLYYLWWWANRFTNGEIEIPPDVLAERLDAEPLPEVSA